MEIAKSGIIFLQIKISVILEVSDRLQNAGLQENIWNSNGSF